MNEYQAKKSSSKRSVIWHGCVVVLILGLCLAGLANPSNVAITYKLLFWSYAGWNLLLLLLHNTIGVINHFKPLPPLLVVLNTGLFWLCISLSITFAIGFWLVKVPLGIKVFGIPFGISTWNRFFRGPVLNLLPVILTIVELIFIKPPRTEIKWRILSYASFATVYGAVNYFVWLCSGTWIFRVDMGIPPIIAVIVAVIYFLGNLFALAISFFARKRLKKRDEELIRLNTEWEQPPPKKIPRKCGWVLVAVAISYSVLCIILAFVVKFPLSKYHITGTMESRFWFNAMNASGVIGQDGGQEVLLFRNSTHSYSYWLYGDTMLGYFDPPNPPVWNGWATNTGMLVSVSFFPNDTIQAMNATYSVGPDGRAVEVLPYAQGQDHHAYGIWPMGAFMYDGYAYSYFEVISRHPNAGFSHYAYGLGRTTIDLSGHIYFERIINESSNLNPVADWLMVDGEYLYLYFSTFEIITGGIKVGRLPLSIYAQNSTFDFPKADFPTKYWSGIGSEFANDFENSPPMHYGDSTQFSVFYNQYLKTYVLLEPGGFLFNQVYMSTSDTPWGPFSKAFLVYDTKIPHSIYCVYSHESMFEENGRIMYLTYSTDDVDNDEPTLIRIELDPK